MVNESKQGGLESSLRSLIAVVTPAPPVLIGEKYFLRRGSSIFSVNFYRRTSYNFANTNCLYSVANGRRINYPLLLALVDPMSHLRFVG